MPDDTAAAQGRTFDAAKFEPAVIAKATEQGWVPPEKYSGKGTWLPPDEFIERGERVTPIIRSRLSAAEQQIVALRAENQQIIEDAREFKKMAVNSAHREWQDKYNELQAQFAKAVQDGEGAAAAAANVELAEHAAAKPKAVEATGASSTAAQEPPRPAWMVAWATQNTWYDTNPNARFMANSIGAMLASTKGLKDEALAEAVRVEMSAKYPELIGEEPPDTRGSTVVAPGRRQPPSGASAQTYDNMPADAKAACARMVSRKWGTQEEYVKSYYAQEQQ